MYIRKIFITRLVSVFWFRISFLQGGYVILKFTDLNCTTVTSSKLNLYRHSWIFKCENVAYESRSYNPDLFVRLWCTLFLERNCFWSVGWERQIQLAPVSGMAEYYNYCWQDVIRRWTCLYPLNGYFVVLVCELVCRSRIIWPHSGLKSICSPLWQMYWP